MTLGMMTKIPRVFIAVGLEPFPCLCCSLERASSKADEFQSHPCVRNGPSLELQNPHMWKYGFLRLFSALKLVPTSAPSLAGLSASVLIFIHQRMDPNQGYSLLKSFRQTIHRFCLRETHLNAGFCAQTLSKSQCDTRRGAGDISYF